MDEMINNNLVKDNHIPSLNKLLYL